MRYALHSSCTPAYLKEADEIIVLYEHRERILDYPSKYPNAAITIQCYDSEEIIDWKWLAAMSKQFQNGFTVGVMKFQQIHEAENFSIKAYLLKPVNNFMELNRLYSAGVPYVYLDAPLFFSLDKIKRFSIPVRFLPTVIDASPGYLTTFEHGTWIRPEDIALYDMIPNSIVEFQNTTSTKAEEAFWRVYAKDGYWKGDLGFLLLEAKGKNIANDLIVPPFGSSRLTCRQHCEEFPLSAGCHICNGALIMANREMVQSYLDFQEEQKSQD